MPGSDQLFIDKCVSDVDVAEEPVELVPVSDIGGQGERAFTFEESREPSGGLGGVALAAFGQSGHPRLDRDPPPPEAERSIE